MFAIMKVSLKELCDPFGNGYIFFSHVVVGLERLFLFLHKS